MGTGGGEYVELKPLSPNMAQLAEIMAVSIVGLPARKGDQDAGVLINSVESTKTNANEMLDSDSVAREQITIVTPTQEQDDVFKENYGIHAFIDTPIFYDNGSGEFHEIPSTTIGDLILEEGASQAGLDINDMEDSIEITTGAGGIPQPIESKWKKHTPATLRTKISPALKRRCIAMPPPTKSSSVSVNKTEPVVESVCNRASLYRNDAEFSKEKHIAIMAQIAAENARTAAHHTIAIANMRASARRDKAVKNAKLQMISEKKAQRLEMHKLQMQHHEREHTLRMEILKSELACEISGAEA